MPKLTAVFFSGMLIGACVSWYLLTSSRVWKQVTPLPESTVEKPKFDSYAIEALGQRIAEAGPLELEQVATSSAGVTARRFSYLSEGRRVSGLLHYPENLAAGAKAPVIIQFRGYADRQNYTTGEGTRRSAKAYAKAGFISVAPDFLGYGQSDPTEEDVLLERFKTYTTALDLIAAVKIFPRADSSRIGLWGHSNGGHIAATVLTITKAAYPTVLWAPVSKPFPYSILYYTDEFPDGGKFLRNQLAKFEKLYDVDKYTFTKGLDKFRADFF